MIPSVTIATSYVPTPPPVVNTTVPGSAILHVPYDNVAPSVSSVQINNNARGNSTATPSNAPAEELVDNSGEETAPQRNTARSGGPLASAQTTFLAQLAGQDNSPQSNVILVQYEKLIAYSNVKYKPSNALKPEAEPAGVFGRILQQEKTGVPVQEASRPAPAPAADQARIAQSAPVAEPQLAAPAPQRAKPAARTREAANEKLSSGIAAYGASIFRVMTQGANHITDLA